MNYCEMCSIAFEDARCPICGNARVHPPLPGDVCFLTEQSTMWGEVLADVLKQHAIPFFYKKALGAGLTLSAGERFERYRFFVPYAELSKAQDLVAELFTPSAEE